MSLPRPRRFDAKANSKAKTPPEMAAVPQKGNGKIKGCPTKRRVGLYGGKGNCRSLTAKCRGAVRDDNGEVSLRKVLRRGRR
jgi:hypothetical protein